MKVLKKYLKKRWIIGALILILALWGVYSLTIGKKKEEKLISYAVRRQTIRETLSFSGSVEAEERATLRFQTAGKLIWIAVKEGDMVKKGQAIASLDQRSLRKTLEKELNDYSKERLDYDQNKDDMREVVIGALNQDRRQGLLRVAEQAQFDLNNSVLDVELQTLSIELANLYSPIGGIVTSVGTSTVGVNIVPTQAEFTIVNPETLYFSATADQTEIVNLKEEMVGEIVFDALADTSANASIASIGFTPIVDETGTVYEVKLLLDQFADLQKLRLGMTGDVTFTLKEQENTIAVPTNFIKAEDGKSYVYTKDSKDKLQKQYVVTAQEIDIATVIRSGLSEGDVIYD